MKVKTYGINGLSEWYGKLYVGQICVNVAFTGGTASPSGAKPAYYMTKDPIAQFVIENSKEFKSGFIHLEMQQEVAGTHPRMAEPKAAPASAPKVARKAEVAKAEEPEKSAEVKEYPEVTGTQAANVILAQYGVDINLVANKTDAKKFAKELNISFPNL